MQEIEPNDFQVHSHFESCIHVRVPKIFKALVKKVNKCKFGPQDIVRIFFKCRCLKCPRIVHLNLKCMSYDQKKGRESNWDSQPQIPLE